ncbi:FAD-dependent oxidoreductase [Variovorax sp. GB1P17]|uniref:FAD-dependent oxidoreductase n=1 Tax=Variovorax sp. GB1P17 TaxID=3443740 RepID=UPI003F4519DB
MGAGPVGLLNALGLAKQGIQVELLEAGPAIAASPRAMVYHWSVLNGLERLGVLEEAEQIGFRKQDYCYLVHKTRERIEWSLEPLADYTAHPYNLHLGQNKLAEIVLARLQAMPNFKIHWNTTVSGLEQDDAGVTVHAETAGSAVSFRGAWLIGADGARSAVRTLLDLPFEGTTWPERFVATNIRYDFEQHGYARSTLLIDDVYGAIIAKIDDTGLWRCTYCEGADLPEESVLERMPEVMRVLLPGAKDYELVQHSPYRMHQRSAPRYRVGRVLLAGDAAHATNPTGGLGLTSGLFDTFVLYEALGAVMSGAVGADVLDKYSEARRKVFVEIASPQASENKRLIYHSSDPARLEQDLQKLRQMQSHKDTLLERLLFTRRLITPSLLSADESIV